MPTSDTQTVELRFPITAWILVKDGLGKINHAERAIYGMKVLDAGFDVNTSPEAQTFLLCRQRGSSSELQWFRLGVEAFFSVGEASVAAARRNQIHNESSKPA